MQAIVDEQLSDFELSSACCLCQRHGMSNGSATIGVVESGGCAPVCHQLWQLELLVLGCLHHLCRDLMWRMLVLGTFLAAKLDMGTGA
jgi:hypothetical protein